MAEAIAEQQSAYRHSRAQALLGRKWYKANENQWIIEQRMVAGEEATTAPRNFSCPDYTGTDQHSTNLTGCSRTARSLMGPVSPRGKETPTDSTIL